MLSRDCHAEEGAGDGVYMELLNNRGSFLENNINCDPMRRSSAGWASDWWVVGTLYWW